MKNIRCVCETVGDLKAFIEDLPDDMPISREQQMAVACRTVYCGIEDYEQTELSFRELDDDDNDDED